MSSGLKGLHGKFSVVKGGVRGKGGSEPPSSGGGNGKDPFRPTFDYDTATRAAVTNEIRKLVGEAQTVLSYGGGPVETEQSPVPGLWEDKEHKKSASFPRPMRLTKERATAHIERVCGFYREGKNGTSVSKPVPDWCGEMIANGMATYFPPLAGVIRHPVITPDGKLRHGEIGYDPVTQYHITAPLNEDLAQIKWSSVGQAVSFLKDDWLEEFQFSEEGDFWRAIMLPLTLLKARTSLATRGKYPAFMVTAPMAATGKTELVECLTRAVTGAPVPFCALPQKDEAEMNKLLLSVASSDPPAVCFDNVPNGWSIKSAVLDQFITRETFQGRLLGGNNVGDFPALALLIAIGNNIEAAEDSATRWIEIRMQPKTGIPQNTVYEKSIRAWTDKHRPKILLALQCLASVEHELTPKGRFAAWFNEVAGPLKQASGLQDLLAQ